MFKQIPSLKYRAAGVPAVYTRMASTPLLRERVRLVGVRLETDRHRVNPNRIYVGVEARSERRLPSGEVVEVWGNTQWLDTAVFRNLLTEKEAEAWVVSGFAPAANDAG